MRSLSWILLSSFLLSCGTGTNRWSRSEQQSLDAEAIELHDPGLAGPFKVMSYLPAGSNSGYRSAIIYYPADSLELTLPTTTLSGGFTNTKENISWLGMHLASHGIVTIVFTPTNPNALDAQVWANGHKASLATIQAESLKIDSPLANRIDSNRLGVMGFSFGGAGAIVAANQLGAKLRSAVPLCAYMPVTPTYPIPFMFITGTNDTVAVPGNILKVFNKLNTSLPKVFVKFNKLAHGDITNGGNFHESIARFATAWSLTFLANVPEYASYISGDEAKKQINNPAVFATTSDYIYQE